MGTIGYVYREAGEGTIFVPHPERERALYTINSDYSLWPALCVRLQGPVILHHIGDLQSGDLELGRNGYVIANGEREAWPPQARGLDGPNGTHGIEELEYVGPKGRPLYLVRYSLPSWFGGGQFSFLVRIPTYDGPSKASLPSISS